MVCGRLPDTDDTDAVWHRIGDAAAYNLNPGFVSSPNHVTETMFFNEMK